MTARQQLRVVPATAANWDDLCALFGARGACGGCWCMTMRLSAAEFAAGKGDGNRRRLHALCAAAEPPGLLGYVGDAAVAWISLGPRPSFAKLATSRVLAPVDGEDVWSIVCMFVRSDHRRQGRSVELLRAAAAHARRRGARVLEGYPQAPRQAAMPPVFAWTGLASAFVAAGFTEVARRSPTRPIFRLVLTRGRSRSHATAPAPSKTAPRAQAPRR